MLSYEAIVIPETDYCLISTSRSTTAAAAANKP